MTGQAMLKSDEFSTQLELAKKEGLNLLMPTMQIAGLSEFHAPVLEKVQLSAKQDDGDVYPHNDTDDPSKQKWRLTKQALMKLSVCGGILWSVEASRRVDDGHDRNYVCYQAVGGIRKADGSPVFFKAQYDLDFEVIEQELRESYEAKAKKWKAKESAQTQAEYVEYCVKRDLLQKRKHGLKLAEAGAMNRVIREIFGLKQAYTAAELSKPFAMARIAFRPDYSDKEVRRALLDAHIKAMTGIYGPAMTTEAAPKETVIDVTPTAADEPDDGKDDGKKTTQESPTIEMMLFDFSHFDQPGKAGVVERVAAKKGYDLKVYLAKSKKSTAAELKPELLTELYKHLLGMPDKEEEDSIPF
jgi:hypothetical protein